MTTAIQTNWPPLRLPRERLAQLRAQGQVVDRDPLSGLTAQVKLLAAGEHFAHARKLVQLLASEHSVTGEAQSTIRSLWPAAILAHAPDVALSLLNERYHPPYQIKLELAPGLPVDVTLMRVHGDTLHFQLSPELFEFHAGDMILDRWVSMFPLWDAFMRSSERIDGTVAVNLLDNGSWPGLTFCEYRPGYYLIPDAAFMALDKYSQYRAEYAAHDVAWGDRAPVAYWRGTTSGIPMDRTLGWRSLPRIRLCEIAAAHPEIIDAGITGISQIDDPEAAAELKSRNLMRDRVHPLAYLNYRYQIDIDGNSNAWDGFFLRLLTGSPVLKVASPFGYHQWYYDRLRPWVNFVPVETDMSDLVEKVTWLRDNDDAARQIGEAGRALADALDEREVPLAIPVIVAAMHANGGGSSTGSRLGVGATNVVLGAGWHAPDQDGVRAAAAECHLTLSPPPGSNDYVLLAEVSIAAGPPRLLTIAANGKPMLSRFIADRVTAYCSLPLPAGEDGFDVAFGFPEGRADLGVMLHRIGVVDAGQSDWLGYPNLDALLAELNAAPAGMAMHDLGWDGTGRGQFILPSGAVPRAIMTYFGTMLYADRLTGRVRHGLVAEVPRNLFAIVVGSLAYLVRAGDNGGYVGVHVRPEGPEAPRDAWRLWAGGGFARSFAIVNENGDLESGFNLRAAGLLACAEPNGDFTLSRLHPGEWEGFHFVQETE